MHPPPRRTITRCNFQIFVSVTSLAWIAACLGTSVLIVVMMFSKAWISSPKQVGIDDDGTIDPLVTPYQHTVGPWWVCTSYDLMVVNLEECDLVLGRLHPEVLPPAWTLAGTLFLVAALLSISGAVSALCSICCQNCLCENRSVFSVTGVIYGFVGIFLVVGFLCFAVGCSHPAVQSDTFCGPDSFLLVSGKCSLNWSFYLSLITIVLCMSTALFSPLVENSILTVPCPCSSCPCCETQEPLMPFPTAEQLRLFYDAYEPCKSVETSVDQSHRRSNSHNGNMNLGSINLNDYEFVRAPNIMRPNTLQVISGSQTLNNLQMQCQSSLSDQRPDSCNRYC